MRKGVNMPDTTIKIPGGLPPGVTQADVEKAFASFMRARISGKAKDLATRGAIKDLIRAHQEEYNSLLARGLGKK